MTAHRRVIEDRADEAEARVARWDAMRARWQADLSTLMNDDKQTLTCLGDAMNAIQEAEAYLSIASAMEGVEVEDHERRMQAQHERDERWALRP